MSFKLRNIRTVEGAADFLWQLLEDRDPVANISHKAMPTREFHNAFVAKHPYRAWYIILDGRTPIGTIYLTRHSEIGVGVLSEHRRKGAARWAIDNVMRKWSRGLVVPKTHKHLGREFYANINPENAASMALFESLGFSFRQVVLARKADFLPDAKRPQGRPIKRMDMEDNVETRLE